MKTNSKTKIDQITLTKLLHAVTKLLYFLHQIQKSNTGRETTYWLVKDGYSWPWNDLVLMGLRTTKGKVNRRESQRNKLSCWWKIMHEVAGGMAERGRQGWPTSNRADQHWIRKSVTNSCQHTGQVSVTRVYTATSHSMLLAVKPNSYRF